MNLFDLRNKYEGQMVLSFSNNNMVTVIDEDFEPNSKFMRRSKIRLSMDFLPVIEEDSVKVFRTFRGTGKADYIVYFSDDYSLIENYRKKKSHSVVLKNTECKQLSIKDVVKPDYDYVGHLMFTCKDNTFQVALDHSELKDTWYSSVHSVNTSNWFVPYCAFIYALSILTRPDQISHIKNHLVVHTSERGLSNILKNNWTSVYKSVQAKYDWYKNELIKYKNILGENNISIVFNYS